MFWLGCCWSLEAGYIAIVQYWSLKMELQLIYFDMVSMAEQLAIAPSLRLCLQAAAANASCSPLKSNSSPHACLYPNFDTTPLLPYLIFANAAQP